VSFVDTNVPVYAAARRSVTGPAALSFGLPPAERLSVSRKILRKHIAVMTRSRFGERLSRLPRPARRMPHSYGDLLSSRIARLCGISSWNSAAAIRLAVVRCATRR